MKKFLVFCLLSCLCLPSTRAQYEGYPTDTSAIIASMDGVGYSSDNSCISRMDINKFLLRADSIFVGYDTLDQNYVYKKAIIFSSKSCVTEAYITSVLLFDKETIPYADYVSFVDDEGLVHEVLNKFENTQILKKFSLLLVRPKTYRARQIE